MPKPRLPLVAAAIVVVASLIGAPPALSPDLGVAFARPPAPAAALRPFAEGDRWGYKDSKGKVVIPPRFILAEPFAGRAIAPVVDDKGFAWIDARGEVVARPFVFDNGADPFSEKLSRIVQDGKHGFIDAAGKIVIVPRFDFVRPFHRGRAAFCSGCRIVKHGEHGAVEGGQWGYLDRTGREVIPASYEAAEDFDKGRARVKKDGKWLTIDLRGTVK